MPGFYKTRCYTTKIKFQIVLELAIHFNDHRQLNYCLTCQALIYVITQHNSEVSSYSASQYVLYILWKAKVLNLKSMSLDHNLTEINPVHVHTLYLHWIFTSSIHTHLRGSLTFRFCGQNFVCISLVHASYLPVLCLYHSP